MVSARGRDRIYTSDEPARIIPGRPGRPDVAVNTNYTGYSGEESSNWEHDDTGGKSNAAGMADLTLNALGDHQAWEKGYDY